MVTERWQMQQENQDVIGLPCQLLERIVSLEACSHDVGKNEGQGRELSSERKLASSIPTPKEWLRNVLQTIKWQIRKANTGFENL